MSQLPQLAEIDFNDSKAVADYGHRLANAYRNLGGFHIEKPTDAHLHIRTKAIDWLKEVERNISRMNAIGIQDYLQWHDIVCRIAYGRSSSAGFTDKWMETALTATARGEKADTVAFMHWLRMRLRRNPSKVSDSHREWYTSVIDSWIRSARTAMMNPRNTYTALPDCTISETSRIIRFLIGEDLYPWIPNQNQFKTHLFAHYANIPIILE